MLFCACAFQVLHLFLLLQTSHLQRAVKAGRIDLDCKPDAPGLSRSKQIEAEIKIWIFKHV